MLKWLKSLATAAVRRSCQYNIRVKVKELVAASSRAERSLLNSGGERDGSVESDEREEYKVTRSLLTDIQLAYSNGLSLEEIKATVVEPVLLEEQASPTARELVNLALTFATNELLDAPNAAELAGVTSAASTVSSVIDHDRYYTRWAMPRNRFEAMASYAALYGLKPEGEHRKFADQLLSNTTETCGTCGGTGLNGTYGNMGWLVCPACFGLGRVYNISREELFKRRQLVLDRYPDAESENWKPGVATEELFLSSQQLKGPG